MASKRRRGRSVANAIDPPLLALMVALVLVAIIAYYTSARYTMLSATLAHPFILHPPLRMFIGMPLNISGQGLQYASVNQTFCPENSTIMTRQARTFVFPYYTSMKPGTLFTYTLVYNTSTTRIEDVAVLPPFRLIAYKVGVMQNAPCVGYPNDTGNMTMVLQAPNYNVTSQFEAVIYLLNRSK